MLDFWETVRGVRLAETLIYTLPELVKEHLQETVRVPAKEAADIVEAKIKDGKRYVDSIPAGEDLLLIFE